MADLISRAKALDTIDGIKPMQGNMEQLAMKALCWAAVKTIQSVDAVTVAHGRWMYKERHRKSYRQYTGFDDAGETHTIMVLEESEGKEPYCSECGAQAAESFMDFCPNCGADMRGDNYGE